MIWRTSLWKNGERLPNSKEIQYFNDGKTIQSISYFDENADICKAEGYHPNQQLRAVHIYNNGEVQSYKFYYENGRLDRSGAFKNGKPHEDWVYYYENGQISFHRVYHEGVIINETLYNENGKIIN